MNLRIIVTSSIALNFLLLGALILKFKTPTNLSPNSVVGSSPKTTFTNSTRAKVVRLDWRSVESEDYKKYVQNLREIGCPEETIFDIIVADVNTLYAMKARSLLPVKEWKFWEAKDETPSREEIKNQKLRRDLENQKRALIAAILGPDALEKLKKYQIWGGEESAERKLAFLAEEKRKKLRQLQEKYFDLEQSATEWNSAGVVTEETTQKLAALAKQRRAEIESLLTPEELTELDLRTSDTAERLRQELNGFHPSEQEFRALFAIRKNLEDQMNANTDIRDPNVLQTRVETQKQLAEKAKSQLGEPRYDEYLRSQDIDYQNILRMTEYFGLPEKAASDVYDLKKQDEKMAQNILANTSVTDEQKNAALEQSQKETEQKLKEILGDRVFNEYRQNNRWWMRSQ
ncbi:MAG: hypothetical protein M3Y82_01940 [Verrucomicrobiota bacterium]|nr:hypothetical protein [Verrucomicrobiota bacterium]